MYPGQRSSLAAPAVTQPNPFAAGPTTATASVQVHYLWVAGRYRDLSSERGLGLAAEAHALGPIPELGDHSDHSGSRPASSHRLANAAAAAGPISKDTSLDRQVNPFLDIRNFSADAGAKAAARTTGVHGARHGSLRTYAADRLKSQELLESRISRATDVERLKWEAKSALLNNGHSLAVLLFIRAGSLGSISSCVTLTKIYASGVTRGHSPRILVIRRDPLRALAWDLEALRLIQRKLEPTKFGAGVYSRSSAAAAAAAGSEAWSADNRQGLEETFRCCELLIRLLRTEQAGLASHPAQPTVLPDIKAQQRLKAELPSNQKKAASRRPDVRLLWDEVAAVIRWLEVRLERSVTLARHRATHIDTVADPDDEFDQDETAEYLEALAVQLAYLRAVQALRTLLHVRSKESLKSAKERWAQSLAAASSSHCPAGMDDVVPLAEAGLAFIHALPEDGWTEAECTDPSQAITELKTRMEEGLSELSVPTVSDASTEGKENTKPAHEAAPSSKSASGTQARAQTNASPPEQSVQKRKSLQEVQPFDVDAMSAAVRSKQFDLTQRLVGASQPSTAGIITVEARGQQHVPRSSTKQSRLLDEPLGHGRPSSIAGLTTASFVGNRLTSPSVIGLDGDSVTPGHKDPFLTPFREAEGLAFPRQRRPSSVVSDTPSLLFGPTPDPGSPALEADKALEAAPTSAAESGKPVRPGFDRKRVVSMYGITPASGSKSTSAPAERFAFPSGPSQPGPRSPPGITRTHRSPSNTTAQDALASTLQRNSNSGAPSGSGASLFLSSQHGRTMSGQASEHLRKLRQQDAASTHSRMNSDAMSTLSRTLSRRQGSQVGGGGGSSISGVGVGVGVGRNARPASLFLAPSVSLRSLSTAALPGSLGGPTSPTLSRPAASASSALDSLRRAVPDSARPSQDSISKATSHLGLSSAEAEAEAEASPSARSTLSKAAAAGGGRVGKARPAPFARTFDSLDPTSRPGSGPTSPRLPDGGAHSPSPSASAGALSPRLLGSQARGSEPAAHAQQLDAALAEAEARSRLHTEGTCAVCGSVCENAPVTKAGVRVCSRDCRMEAKRRAAAGAGAGGEATVTTPPSASGRPAGPS